MYLHIRVHIPPSGALALSSPVHLQFVFQHPPTSKHLKTFLVLEAGLCGGFGGYRLTESYRLVNFLALLPYR